MGSGGRRREVNYDDWPVLNKWYRFLFHIALCIVMIYTEGRRGRGRTTHTHTHTVFLFCYFLFLPLVFGLMLSPSARKLTFWFPVVRQLATAGAWHGYNKTLRENYPILCPHLPKKKKKEERRRQKIWCSITYINLPLPLSFFLNGNVSKAFETHTGDPHSIHLTINLFRVTLYILTKQKRGKYIRVETAGLSADRCVLERLEGVWSSGLGFVSSGRRSSTRSCQFHSQALPSSFFLPSDLKKKGDVSHFLPEVQRLIAHLFLNRKKIKMITKADWPVDARVCVEIHFRFCVLFLLT